MIRTLLAQEAAMVRGALAALLGQEADIRVVAEVAVLEQILPSAQRHRPDVLVLDGDLLGGFSEEVAEQLFRAVPDCRLLILTDVRRARMLVPLIQHRGPDVGVIAVQAQPDQLVAAIRELFKGKQVIDPSLAIAALTAEDNPLTPREREVLTLAAEGAPVKEIAGRLFLTCGTVRNYLSRILSKTGARTRIEAILIARQAGWL